MPVQKLFNYNNNTGGVKNGMFHLNFTALFERLLNLHLQRGYENSAFFAKKKTFEVGRRE
jgi:hypothetical protein